MNKLYITSALIFASIATVGAQQEVSGREGMMRQAPTMMGQITSAKIMPATLTSEAKYVGGDSNVQGQRMMPPIDKMTTGDPKIDAKVKELMAERDLKLKAIHEEYMLKLKDLIGDRQIKNNGPYPYSKDVVKEISSSTIQERVLKEIQIKKAQELERVRTNSYNNMPSDTAAMRAKMLENNMEIKSVGAGIVAQFNSLFRGLFSGSGN